MPEGLNPAGADLLAQWDPTSGPRAQGSDALTSRPPGGPDDPFQALSIPQDNQSVNVSLYPK